MATQYTDAEVERALRELVMADDNIGKCLLRLEAANIFTPKLPRRTLTHWRTTQEELYERLRGDREFWTAQAMAEQVERAASTMGHVEEKLAKVLLSKSDDELRELSPQTLANAIQKATTSKAQNVDKANILRGRPSVIKETRDLDGILKTLQKRFGNVVQVNEALLEGEATEIPADPKELEEETSE